MGWWTSSDTNRILVAISQLNTTVLANQIATKNALGFLKKEITDSMSTTNDAIQTFAAKVEANFANLKIDIAALQDGIAANKKQIADLQAQIAAGSSTLNATDSAALQALVDDSASLDTLAKGTVVPPVPPVTGT